MWPINSSTRRQASGRPCSNPARGGQEGRRPHDPSDTRAAAGLRQQVSRRRRHLRHRRRRAGVPKATAGVYNSFPKWTPGLHGQVTRSSRSRARSRSSSRNVARPPMKPRRAATPRLCSGCVAALVATTSRCRRLAALVVVVAGDELGGAHALRHCAVRPAWAARCRRSASLGRLPRRAVACIKHRMHRPSTFRLRAAAGVAAQAHWPGSTTACLLGFFIFMACFGTRSRSTPGSNPSPVSARAR